MAIAVCWMGRVAEAHVFVKKRFVGVFVRSNETCVINKEGLPRGGINRRRLSENGMSICKDRTDVGWRITWKKR